jgi:hypothetical protein
VSSDFLMILAVAGAAAIASPIGGLIALWRKPTTLFMSLALGFAGGVLLGTISFEMMPQALELTSITIAVAGFVLGFVTGVGAGFSVRDGRRRDVLPDRRRSRAGSRRTPLPAVRRPGGRGRLYDDLHPWPLPLMPGNGTPAKSTDL